MMPSGNGAADVDAADVSAWKFGTNDGPVSVQSIAVPEALLCHPVKTKV
jgi:hypothetical protein